MKCNSNLDIDWFYIAMKCMTCSQILLTCDPQCFQGCNLLLNSCIFWMKCSSNLDIDWFYIAWNIWHAARFCLPEIPSAFKGVTLTSLNIYTTSHSFLKRHFMFRTIGFQSEFWKQRFHWFVERSVWDDPQWDVIRSKQCSETVWIWF